MRRIVGAQFARETVLKRTLLTEKPVPPSVLQRLREAAEKANISIDADDLWVKSAYVDRGPTKNRRRVRPAPQGRAYRERRHFCHVTILLSSEPAEPKEGKPARGDGKTATAKPAKRA